MSKKIKENKITTEIILPTGLRVGTMQVITPDIINLRDKEEYIKRCIDYSIRACIDRIFYVGMNTIIKEDEKR